MARLTPKGLNVPGMTKRFWTVSFDFILYLDYLKLCVHMRLAISFAGIHIS
jgi:hypothetical protein